MTAHQNRLVTSNFIEESDILIVTWTNTKPYTPEEVQESIDSILEMIRKYNCSKLLIDASGAEFSMDNEALTAALTNFASELSQTSIKKLARIITSDASRENRNSVIRSGFEFPFEIYDISNREQALHWLEAS